jgi:hypothetical protein
LYALSSLDLAMPKLRSGSFFPSLLERRRRIDQALFAVIMGAYVHGVSTRSVDDPVKALGADSGIPKSEVSRICADLDTQLTAFRGRPLDHTRFPYVYLDATYCKARVAHQIVSRAVVIATGITEDRGREVLGVMVGDSETEVFWTQFLHSLRERGLGGVRLVLGDHHSEAVRNQPVASGASARWSGMAITEAILSQLDCRFSVLLPHLNERQRRLAVAAEARLLGHGGVRAAARAARMSETTVRRGVAELESGAGPLPDGRTRTAGGGRQPKWSLRAWWTC